jgi:hypothetical protein
MNSIINKLLQCIDYCQEQNETSCGEILEELSSQDFDEMRIVITTMLEVSNGN